MEVNKQTKKKFQLIFDKLFQENYELDSHATDNLLKYLAEDHKIVESPYVSDLILSTLPKIGNASVSVKLFLLEITAVLLKNELQFSRLAHMHGFHMLNENIYGYIYDHSKRTPTLPTSIALAGIKIATMQTTHSSGVAWLIEYKVWEIFLKPNTHSKSIAIRRASYNFASKLIKKLNEYDEESALIDVLQFVVGPLRTSPYVNITVMNIDDEAALYEPILMYVDILHVIVKDFVNYTTRNKVCQLLTKYFIIEPCVRMIMCATKNAELCSKLCEISFYLTVFSAMETMKINGKKNYGFDIISDYINFTTVLISRRMLETTVKYAVNCVLIWNRVYTSILPDTFERHGKVYDIRSQLITLVYVPLVTYISLLSRDRDRKEMKEALNFLAIKMTSITAEHLVKVAYVFRDTLETSDGKQIVIQALRDIFLLKDSLNVSQAGLLYQALFYTLRLHVTSDGQGALILNNSPLKTPDDVKLLSLTMEAIKMLLKRHAINWYENVEIVSLQKALMDLVKQNFMPPKQLMQAIDLIDLTIKKFLSPDMALLMESRSGSTLAELGAVMRSHIQHDEWEIRDSTLHLLLSCIEVAFVKYMPLQKLLQEHKLMILATHAAMQDPEYYVRTTALRCLAAATKTKSLWNEVTAENPNLYVQLIYMLRHNSEGIVRKEAANVLVEMYNHQKTSGNFTRCLYNVMASAVLDDLHWEVQTTALSFFKAVVGNHMSNRGMIDGTFPTVTFSREKRKIITLDEKEIAHQLDTLMRDLSAVGCLTVLHRCLTEEYHLEVMEQAYNITRDLMGILTFYKFHTEDNEIERPVSESPEIIIDCTSPSPSDCSNDEDEAMDLSFASHRCEKELRAQVMDNIVNTDIHDLIAECSDRYFEVKQEPMEEEPLVPGPLKDLVDISKFVKDFRSTDYFSIIENKKNWCKGPNNLEGLLDEILSYECHEESIADECI